MRGRYTYRAEVAPAWRSACQAAFGQASRQSLNTDFGRAVCGKLPQRRLVERTYLSFFSLDGTTLYLCFSNVAAAAAVAICRKSFVWKRSFRPGIDERLLSERYRCDHVSFLSFTQLRTTKADILSERYRSRSSTSGFRSPCSISYRCNAILYTMPVFLTHSFLVANSIDVSTSSFLNISV